MAEDGAYNHELYIPADTNIETMLVKCWICIADGESTLNQR